VDHPPAEVYDVLNFFETVGLLANRGYLNKTDVWEEYADARPLVAEEQKNEPVNYTNFASLMDDLQEIDKAHGGKKTHPSPDELYSFYADEAEARPGEPVRQASKKMK